MVRAEAKVIIPPTTQAIIPIIGEPASLKTIPGFRNIPEPIIIPTTIAMASIYVIVFFCVFSIICSS